MTNYTRPHGLVLANRLTEPRRFIQVVAGPRQVGKTTLVQQVTEGSGLPVRYASADQPTLRSPMWIGQQWELARAADRDADQHGAVLVLDEVQKIPNWSESIKRLWDEDTRARRTPQGRVARVGSAAHATGPHREPGRAI